MKNLTLFSLVQLLFINLSYSQIYYNVSKDYLDSNSVNTISEIVIVNDSLYCFGGNSANGKLDIYFSVYDNETNHILTKTFSKDSVNLFTSGLGSGIAFYNERLYVINIEKKNNESSQGWLLKINKIGDTIFSKHIHEVSTIGEAFRKIKNYDTKIMLFGYINRYDSTYNHLTNQYLLIEVDTNGNQIWKKEYGMLHSVEYPNGFKKSNDDGFFLFGSINPENQYGDFYIIKVDSNGNLLWQKTWSYGINDDEINDIYELPNGNIVIYGRSGEPGWDNGNTQAYMAELSPNGTQVSNERLYFKHIQYHYFTKVFKNTDGTYDVWGYEDYKLIRPFLMKMSANFDSLDVQYYSFWNGPGAQNYLRDIVRMPDNGYVACGFGWDDNSNEDGWLLRIDSNGCANVSCTPLAVAPSPSGRVGVGLYPNPANDIVTIESSEAINKIEIINAQGQVMETINCNNTLKFQLYTLNYQNGIYFYTISLNNNRTVRGKFLIQH